MSEWRDIESAPKDGSAILLGYFRKNLDGSIYQEGGQPVVARWLPKVLKRKDGEEFNWSTPRTRLRSGDAPFTPTHWHPLPEPLK